MDVYILGAGKPFLGKKPSALKNILYNKNVLGWQIQTYKESIKIDNLNFLGGYNVKSIIKKFPSLNITIISNWNQNSILNSFLKSPFSKNSAFVNYADTIFRKETITRMTNYKEDIVVCIDSLWLNRYPSRAIKDRKKAEKIRISKNKIVEFTGLIYFKENIIDFIRTNQKKIQGKNLIDLINFFKKNNYKINYHDVYGEWAEFNSPKDVAQFILGTKAETLERLKPFAKNYSLAEQIFFTVKEWKKNKKKILKNIKEKFINKKIIIRSSSKNEDNWSNSKAGLFESLPDIEVNSEKKLIYSINKVLQSYKSLKIEDEQILVQEYLNKIKISGVIFTCSLETGAPYYYLNFDDLSNSTSSVTSGITNELRMIVLFKLKYKLIKEIDVNLFKVIKTIKEIEGLLNYDKLDIEFAVTKNNKIYILQVRPIAVDHSNYEIDQLDLENKLKQNVVYFQRKNKINSFPYGNKKIFANMPDWNPAEIIGSRPKPLALSLYKYLITDEIWAIQRNDFGYQDLNYFPLVSAFAGQPYVDVNASLNSFIPKNLKSKTKIKLANAYLSILSENQYLHDKIEFEIAITIWTPDFFKIASNRLKKYGITNREIIELESELIKITQNALIRLNKDIKPIKLLTKNRRKFISKKIPIIDKIYYLTKDCKINGCLPFAHAARAGFVSKILLKSFVDSNYITNIRKIKFLNFIKTISGNFSQDIEKYNNKKIKLSELVKKYGHLRPGTYEISAEAYWENPEKYFDNKNLKRSKKQNFIFNKNEISGFKIFLNEIKSNISVNDFILYLSNAIKTREYIKFEFTKNISLVLDLIVELKSFLKLSRSDLSFLEINDIIKLKTNEITIEEIRKKIKIRKGEYNYTQMIELPFMIKEKNDFYCFEKNNLDPNFITLNKIEANIQHLKKQNLGKIHGKIVLISQADPGYDWIFNQGVLGLITKYGGANSHMAIRAAENNLPSVIGVGEKLYDQLINAKRVLLDCENKIINILC